MIEKNAPEFGPVSGELVGRSQVLRWVSLIVSSPKHLAEGPMKVGDRLNAIEKELAEIKAALSSSRPPRVVRLKGLWKGLKVGEAGIAEAKKSLFKHASS